MASFSLHNASKRLGKKQIIKDVSFSLQTGEILGIFGRNGCGKSTLLKLLFGTLKADSINISLEGVDISTSQNIGSGWLAYLPQQPFLPMNLKVRDIIPLYFSEDEKQDRIFYDPLIAKISDKRVNKLSLGQIRYFEILLISNCDHPFMLLDEPFSMIDPLHKSRIKENLLSLKKEKGIIVTDHYYEDVLEIASQYILIKNGASYTVISAADLEKHEYLPKNKA